MGRPNVLFVTLDQLRADSLSCAGHPLVQSPVLDRLAATGVRFARHFAQAAPCAPGRAALYTGTYQMNNRVVANGTPLDRRLDNVAWAARRAGYQPVLFGYTDQGVDPRTVPAGDPRLSKMWDVLPGFAAELDLHHNGPWVEWLRELGHDVANEGQALATEHERPVQHGISAYLTDHLVAWLQRQDEPWFVHASYLRPHPPFSAAGAYATRYDPADCEDPLPAEPVLHPVHQLFLQHPAAKAPARDELRRWRAQYYGMITDVDAQLGRVFDAIDELGERDRTVVVVTADHGEQLGDHGLVGKLGYFEESYRVPAIVRDPSRPQAHGTVVEHFTENVDVLPTLCELMGIEVPAQCDGLPLTPFLEGAVPPWWRDGAHYEFDWRDALIGRGEHPWPWDRSLQQCNLAVRRSADRAYVHVADGTSICFDLAADPTWSTIVDDPAVRLAEAEAMLAWRVHHADRTLTDMLLRKGGIGRLPAPI